MGELESLGIKSFKIMSVNHSAGRLGTYFNFNKADFDKIIGNQDWSNKKFSILNPRTKKVAKAVFWRGENGGKPGDAHGRWDDHSVIWVSDEKIAEHKDFRNDWNTGDTVLVLSEESLAE